MKNHTINESLMGHRQMKREKQGRSINKVTKKMVNVLLVNPGEDHDE